MTETLTLIGLFFCALGFYYAVMTWIGRDL
jgi:hypothetical protein